MNRSLTSTAALLLLLLLELGQPISARAGAPARGDIATAPTEICPLSIGTMIPDVELRDPAGATVSLRAAISGGPAVLVFYRGGW